jgi:hypothetical protein
LLSLAEGLKEFAAGEEGKKEEKKSTCSTCGR